MIIFQRIIRNKATISVVLLPTIVAFTISIYLSIQPCSLSSKVGSIVQFICLIMPCLAQVCERLRSHTTDLPWQTKSTFIIVLFLLVLPRNALFCKIFWNSCSLLWNYRLWQIIARLSKLVLPVSSKIGSNTSKSYYLECYTKFYKKKNPTHQVLPGVIRRHPPQFLYIIYYFCIKYARILWFANEFL